MPIFNPPNKEVAVDWDKQPSCLLDFIVTYCNIIR